MVPPVLAPMLCGASGAPTSSGRWLREPKWDGVRAIVTLDGDGGVTLRSRLDNDITGGYPELVTALQAAPRPIVLDAEIVADDADGRPSFNRLQERMHVRNPSPELLARTPVRLVAFDVLWDDGADLCPRPQHERRTHLEAVSTEPWFAAERRLELSPLLPDGPDHDELLEATVAVGFEGYVAKRFDAPYAPGRRSPAWVKAKSVRTADVVVGGWEPGEGRRDGAVGSLALGLLVPEHADALLDGGPCLHYVGGAGSGLNDAMLTALRPMTKRFAADATPFLDLPPSEARVVRPLMPVLVVEVAYAMVSPNGKLRFPVVKGLRPDKRPADCTAL